MLKKIIISTAVAASALTALPAAAEAQIRVLGLSWTWYGETLDDNAKPVIYDFNSTNGGPSRELEPKVEMGIVDGDGPSAVSYGPWDDDGYSSVETTTGSNPTLLEPNKLHYRARFSIKGANVSTILLASPVLDDVTLYWRGAGPVLISYVLDNRSF